MQIVPRFATFVYFNCVTGECLVNENEYIRRFVCGCSNLDPTNPDRGTCSGVGSVNGCNSDDDIMSFGSIDAIYKAESETTSRYMLMGRRCARVAVLDAKVLLHDMYTWSSTIHIYE